MLLIQRNSSSICQRALKRAAIRAAASWV